MTTTEERRPTVTPAMLDHMRDAGAALHRRGLHRPARLLHHCRELAERVHADRDRREPFEFGDLIPDLIVDADLFAQSVIRSFDRDETTKEKHQ
jgi:hypothetical protein